MMMMMMMKERRGEKGSGLEIRYLPTYVWIVE
jgi:hypothetical protein